MARNLKRAFWTTVIFAVVLGSTPFWVLPLIDWNSQRERPGFVGSHEAAITDNVGNEDGGQPAVYAFFAHGKPLAGEIAV